MVEFNPSVPPWRYLEPRTVRILRREGVTSAEKIARMGGRELRDRFGERAYQDIRRIWRDPSVRPDGTIAGAVNEANGGMLVAGNPGNAGGQGRLVDRVRRRATEHFEEGVELLAEVLHDRVGGEVCPECGRGIGERVPIDQRMKAADLLGKYGPGTRRELESKLDEAGARRLARELAAGVQKHVREERVLRAILGEWSAVLRDHFA